jgi:hypothetical protein
MSATKGDGGPEAWTCVGSVDDLAYYKAKALLADAADAFVTAGTPAEAVSADCRALLEPEFEAYLVDATRSLGGEAFSHVGSPLIVRVRYPLFGETHVRDSGRSSETCRASGAPTRPALSGAPVFYTTACVRASPVA